MILAVASAEGIAEHRVYEVAAAIELLHNYSLIHDDIEDHDELRRGRKTLWAKYGLPQALNAGDALCALSFITLADAAVHHPPARVLRMVRVLHEAHAEMCEGQSLDLAFEGAELVGVDLYDRMIAAKTAALFGAACELGALCTAANDDTIARYRKMGRAFGMAFQIRDDELGISASTDDTGKISGNDIARRKWTFPVVWALGGTASDARHRVERAYSGSEPMAAPEVAAVAKALRETGAIEAARRAVAEHLGVVERHPPGDVRDLLLESLT
ncbi:MAG: polyprenyl synthetase family protein [Candidatus Eremiobacteraeota bacterium]|nr:polyprenyl synthetase family protein [Candidatus Eremiobacteraeota bacterium]